VKTAARAVRLAAALALALAAAACGDDGGNPGTDGPGPDGDLSDAMPDGPPMVTLTSFVIELVSNQTAGDTDPRPYAEFATLPDPDADNPDAYGSLFP
jgi:hypothetical protein